MWRVMSRPAPSSRGAGGRGGYSVACVEAESSRGCFSDRDGLSTSWPGSSRPSTFLDNNQARRGCAEAGHTQSHYAVWVRARAALGKLHHLLHQPFRQRELGRGARGIVPEIVHLVRIGFEIVELAPRHAAIDGDAPALDRPACASAISAGSAGTGRCEPYSIRMPSWPAPPCRRAPAARSCPGCRCRARAARDRARSRRCRACRRARPVRVPARCAAGSTQMNGTRMRP